MKGMMMTTMNNSDIKPNTIWKRDYHYIEKNRRGTFFIIVIDVKDNTVRFKVLDDEYEIMYSYPTHELIRDYTHVQ